MISRQRALIGMVLFGLSAVLLAGASNGQDDKTDPDSPAALDPGLTKVDLAYSLIDYGRTQKTPEALVTAAMILMKIPVFDYAETPVEKPKLSTEQLKDISAILDEAAQMRPTDKLLKELVSRAQDDLKEASRSLVDPRMIARIEANIARGKTKHMARKTYQKGQTIQAVINNPVGQISVVDAKTNRIIAKGKRQVAVRAPQTSNYDISVTNPGSLAIPVTMSLR